MIEEHFEFAIRAAHTVKISGCAHCIVRLPRDFRHTTAIVIRRRVRAAANSRSLGLPEVAADFSFSHRSSDQDYPEIAPNDADGLVT